MTLDGPRVVIVGGGHNGLVAAGLLAKRGARVTVLERRHQVGGAAITEQPWGTEYKMTALSYVMSLMPPVILEELQLARFGYRIHPQHGYFSPLPEGRYLQLDSDEQRRHEQISKFSSKDASAMVRWEAWLGDLAATLGPLLSAVPPKLGSKRPRDLLEQARLAWRVRGVDHRKVGDITRLFTMSIADLLEEWFESPEMQGVLAVSGVIGTWAGPRSAGTAYVMAHHQIGDLGDGQVTGQWGFPEGGMGAVSEALRAAAESFGATIRTESPVARIDVRHGHTTGVTLESGEAIRSDIVIATTHPRITFLEHLDRRDLPDDLIEGIERWRSRSGTVKVNLALDRLPEFVSRPGFDPDVHGGTIVLAPSIDAIESAFQDAVNGLPARQPFADICIPSVFDRTLAPEGHHVMSMFTQWVPHEFAAAPHTAELDAYADRLVARVEELAPGFTSSVLHRQVIGPYDMEHTYGLIGGNIFHGELTTNQMFHMRPVPGYADFTTPIAGLYQGGSATHGGGGVTGIPALQVVRRIEHDRRSGALAKLRRRR
jgi:phytoene dehydrogenase-like protein